MKKTVLALFVISLLTIFASLSFAVPVEINFQGYLTDSNGVPVDGTTNITFKLYNHATETQPVNLKWDSGVVSVDVTNGVYSVILGDTSAGSTQPVIDPAIFADQLWLGIEVESDGEMGPRQRLTASGYTIRAGSAETADTVPDSAITSSKISPPIILNADDPGALLSITNTNTDGVGVKGVHAGNGEGAGVWGDSATAYGVYGSSSDYVGVWGESFSPSGVGVWGNNSAGGLAGRFDGDVLVNGNISGNGSGLTGITTSSIADGSITDVKITGPISGTKLGAHSHSGSDILDSTVTLAKLDPNICETGQMLINTPTGWECVNAPPYCGNKVLDNGEECDDGTLNSDVDPDACRSNCVLPYCGDSVTDSLETCDDGNSNINDDCPDGAGGTCQVAFCGDGFVHDQGSGTEECDDGNSDNLDSCANDCTLTVTCGEVGYASNGTLGDVTLGLTVTVNTDTGEITDESGTIVAAALTAPPATSSSDPGVTVVSQPDIGGVQSPQIAVFHFNSLTIPVGSIVNVIGSRSLALLSKLTIDMNGTVDISGANGTNGTIGNTGIGGGAGPGGWDGGSWSMGSGCAAGNGQAYGPGAGAEGDCGEDGSGGNGGTSGGGGGGAGGACSAAGGSGGGHAFAGGNGSTGGVGTGGTAGVAGPGNPGSGGGFCNTAPSVSSGGPPYGSTDIIVLTGGSGGSSGGFGGMGGFGGDAMGSPSWAYGGAPGGTGGPGGGGGGGGAVLLCSLVNVTLSGVIDTSGGFGGAGGMSGTSSNGESAISNPGPTGGGGGGGRSGAGGGSGGGAGGTIHLMAPAVTINSGAYLDAGGGGGGIGGFSSIGGFGGAGVNGGGAGGNGGNSSNGGSGGDGSDGYITIHSDSITNNGISNGVLTTVPVP